MARAGSADTTWLTARAIASDRAVSTEEFEALLFQTGYLTITGAEELGGKALYRLGYPNREVRQSLNEHLLRHLVQDVERQTSNSMRLARLLERGDCAGLKELFHACYASIPYEWYAGRPGRRTNDDLANYEGYYASVFYSYFAALGYEITVEESTVEESSSHGRLDMAVRTGGHVYLFEFKVVEMSPPGSALAQLQERDYAAKYRGRGERRRFAGIERNRVVRIVVAGEIEIGAVRLPHGGIAGRSGEVAVGGEDRILIAVRLRRVHEHHHDEDRGGRPAAGAPAGGGEPRTGVVEPGSAEGQLHR